MHRPSGASAKISAPHFRQTLGALIMLESRLRAPHHVLRRISGIRYVRNTVIKMAQLIFNIAGDGDSVGNFFSQ